MATLARSRSRSKLPQGGHRKDGHLGWVLSGDRSHPTAPANAGQPEQADARKCQRGRFRHGGEADALRKIEIDTTLAPERFEELNFEWVDPRGQERGAAHR